MLAGQGVAEADARTTLEAAFDTVPLPARDQKWAQRRAQIPRWVKKDYGRVAKRKSKLFSALVDHLEYAPL